MKFIFVEIYFIGYLKFNYIYNLLTQMNKQSITILFNYRSSLPVGTFIVLT